MPLSIQVSSLRLCIVIALFVIIISITDGFVPSGKNSFVGTQKSKRINHESIQLPVLWARDDESDEEDEEDDELLDIDLSERDWRAFRAKLVMGEAVSSTSPSSASTSSEPKKMGKMEEEEIDGDLDGIGKVFLSTTEASTAEQTFQGMTPLDPSQWAYDSGKVIEQGAVILGGVEQDYGFGLRQQYFHKAAILVLSHEETTFTKGIILNRPTDLTLDDDINPNVKWRVWFGGDVQGFNSGNPDIVCLHSIKDDRAVQASTLVMKDIRWTSFESAKRLVKLGIAKPSDFWVFCGYAGWGPGQLMGELDRKSWYMVATDSQTLLKELARQGAGADPRDAGLETWTLLMNMIGRSETVQKHTGDFDDLMLKEWALKNLLSKGAGGGATEDLSVSKVGFGFMQQKRLLDASLRGKVKPGTILRAAFSQRSPFLLEEQELHKSILLIINDDANVCIGAILNRPAAKGLDIQITQKNSKISRKIQVPLRYGGQFAVKGSDPLIWLHCDNNLKSAGIGTPVGNTEGIWKCTSNDVITAVGQGLASPREFMVVSGVVVFFKGQEADKGDQSEKFEVVPEWKVGAVWQELCKQEVLSPTTLDTNLMIADRAWHKGAEAFEQEKNNGKKMLPIFGLGEGHDEGDGSLVFKSDMKVSKLCDSALRSWIATFLLGSPSLSRGQHP